MTILLDFWLRISSNHSIYIWRKSVAPFQVQMLINERRVNEALQLAQIAMETTTGSARDEKVRVVTIQAFPLNRSDKRLALATVHGSFFIACVIRLRFDSRYSTDHIPTASRSFRPHTDRFPTFPTPFRRHVRPHTDRFPTFPTTYRLLPGDVSDHIPTAPRRHCRTHTDHNYPVNPPFNLMPSFSWDVHDVKCFSTSRKPHQTQPRTRVLFRTPLRVVKRAWVRGCVSPFLLGLWYCNSLRPYSSSVARSSRLGSCTWRRATSTKPGSWWPRGSWTRERYSEREVLGTLSGSVHFCPLSRSVLFSSLLFVSVLFCHPPFCSVPSHSVLTCCVELSSLSTHWFDGQAVRGSTSLDER